MTDLATNVPAMVTASGARRSVWRLNALFVAATALLPIAAVGLQHPSLCVPFAGETDCVSPGGALVAVLALVGIGALLAALALAPAGQRWRQVIVMAIGLPAVLVIAYLFFGSYGLRAWPNPYCALGPTCDRPPTTEPWIMP